MHAANVAAPPACMKRHDVEQGHVGFVRSLVHGFLACLSVQLDGKCFPPFLRREDTLLPEGRLILFHPRHIRTDLLLVHSELGSVYRDTLQVRLFPEVSDRRPELSKCIVRLWDQSAVRQLAPF